MQVVVEPSSLRTTENNSQPPPPQQQQQFFCSSMAEYDGNPHNPRALLKSKKQATYRSSLVLRYQTKLNRDAARHFMRVSQRNLRERRMELAGRVWARLLFARPFRELAADATVRALWRKGLPPAARGAVWPLAVGNALNITGTLYEVVKQRAWEVLQEHGTPLPASATSPRDVRSVSAVSCPSPGDTARDAAAAVAATAASDGSDEYRSPPPPSSSHRRPTDSTPSPPPSPSQGWLRGRESSIKLLLIDAPRTHLGPGRSLFAVGAPLHESLLSVLGAYAFYRPDVGYVQGMSYLAGMLLLYCRDEATAFLCLANLLNRAPYPALLRMESSLLSRKLELFERALNEQLPALASHLSELGCAPDLYLIEWLFTLFAKSHNLEVAGRVWDCFLLEGESFLLRTAIATLRLLSDEILACGELGAVLRILKRSTRALSEQELFDMVQATPISQSVAKMAELASVEYFTPRVVGT
ncbi:TBC1 domain family protein [Pseudoscourfieldia marina]